MGVFEGLGDEIRPDDLLPRRGAKDVRAAVGKSFVHDIPDLDLAFVAAYNSGDVIVHPLQQLLAGRARPVHVKSAKATSESTAKSSPAKSICPKRVGSGG